MRNRIISVAVSVILVLSVGACASQQAAEVVIQTGTALLLAKTRSEVYIAEQKLVSALEGAAPGDVDWHKVNAVVRLVEGARAMMDVGKSAIVIAKEAQSMVAAGITMSGSGDPLADVVARRRALIFDLRSRTGVVPTPPPGGPPPGPASEVAPAFDPAAVDGLTIDASPGGMVLGQLLRHLGL